jgi:hypothetical protein
VVNSGSDVPTMAAARPTPTAWWIRHRAIGIPQNFGTRNVGRPQSRQMGN